MQKGRNPGVVWQLAGLAVLWFSGATGCSTAFSPTAAPLPVGAPTHKASVMIDSSPGSALISVNGQIKGSAPVTIEVELDDLGEVAIELEIKADFADSLNSKLTAVTTHLLNRGERPPSVIRFDPDGAVSH